MLIREIDPAVGELARRIVEIQRAAYAVEAGLIGFDGIPQLAEDEHDVRRLGHMSWRGAFVDDLLVGLIAWERSETEIEIDRLAVDPTFARRGIGRLLVRSVPPASTILVSTGEANHPAVGLYRREGFEPIGSVEVAPEIFVTRFQRES